MLLYKLVGHGELTYLSSCLAFEVDFNLLAMICVFIVFLWPRV